MATRVILTIQEEVECALCGRHLLRGERPDVFNVDGSERIVCELCGPRALSSGWERGGGAEAGHEAAGASSRSDRRRGFRALLRRSGSSAEEPSTAERNPAIEELDYSFGDLFEPDPEVSSGGEEPDTAELAILAAPEPLAGSRSPDGSETGTGSGPLEPVEDLAAPEPSDRPEPSAEPQLSAGTSSAGTSSPGTGSEIHGDLLRSALETFNAGEYPERVASIARLLGPPSVAVRRVPDREAAAWITVAWEICWHRYEVDAGEGSQARRVAEGMELGELPELEREPNAVLGEHGELQPIAA